MLLTSRIRKAVVAMVILAQNEQSDPVPLWEISKILGISLSNLEQIFSLLKKSKLVKSTKGPGGGYTLTYSADSIKVSQIVSAVGEPRFVPSTRDGSSLPSFDAMTKMWDELEKQGMDLLGLISLASLIPENQLTLNSNNKSKIHSGIHKRSNVSVLPDKVVNSVFCLK